MRLAQFCEQFNLLDYEVTCLLQVCRLNFSMIVLNTPYRLVLRGHMSKRAPTSETWRDCTRCPGPYLT